ncbi:MAG TPA: ABC transporter permease [Gammaproteobacteria bacterium]|nr:ABC transporter permease [Gammaproteobacteria bacterium]
MRNTHWLRDAFGIFALNLRSALARPMLPVIIIVGFIAVVLVMVAVLSIGRGLGNTFGRTGSADVAMVLSNGAYSETVSHLDAGTIHTLASFQSVAQSTSGPVASPELVVTANVPKRGSGVESNVVLRGVTANGFVVHPKVHIVAGRNFKAGLHEIIVGKQAANEYDGLNIGDVIHTCSDSWRVVGIFAADGNLHESEIWTDAQGLQTAFHLGSGYSVDYLKLNSPAAYKTFATAVKKNPALDVQVKSEKNYYQDMAKGASKSVTTAGMVIAILMALGAIIGAINLMYTSLSGRGREMATLRAIGYRRLPVLVAVLFESLMFGLIGGVIGGGIAYAIFNGFQAGTLMGGVTQVAFQFSVPPALLAGGVIFALIMGLIGGIFPAIRTARLPIVTALREA